MKILAVELSDEECANILTTAIESGHDGIGYWLDQEEECQITRDLNGNIFWAHLYAEMEDDKKHPYTVTFLTIRDGMSRALAPGCQIRPDIIKNVLDDNCDAEGADCIVQLGLFGEIVFS